MIVCAMTVPAVTVIMEDHVKQDATGKGLERVDGPSTEDANEGGTKEEPKQRGQKD